MPTKKPIVKRAPRTVKEKKFATDYVKFAPQVGSAKAKVMAVRSAEYKVGSDTAARVIASENLRKLTIVDMMDEIPGLRKEDRLKIMANGLYATKANEYTGEVDTDHASVYKYLRLSFELDGSLAKNNEAPSVTYIQMIQQQNNGYGSEIPVQ